MASGPPNAAPADVEDIASEAFVAVDWRGAALSSRRHQGPVPGFAA
ncbi:hypothetical protein OHA61_38600 [Streptomyces sp. NBC_00885]|nr:hypothetical protein OHA61_38600 [Streptomyces sp. NBC_00885]